MADPYYYQENDEIHGPLTPSALKQLADKGVIIASTPVRKGEQGAWYQAGTIAGLVPPRPVESEAAPSVEADTAERARRTFRKAEEQAEKVAAKLWFLDLKFSQFFTPKLVGLLWALNLCLVAIFFLGSLASTVYYLFTLNPLHALFMIVVQFFALLCEVIFTRIVLEVFLVTFRISDQLERMKNPANDAT
jgi:hypothetical protein